MLKIPEVKVSSCGLEVADLRKNCDCGIAIAEVLSSSCGIAIADSKKVARAHLCLYVQQGLGKLLSKSNFRYLCPLNGSK
jgi:hypothetical protein